MLTVSLDTAIAVTEWSRRTWWRRISDGVIERAPDDTRGRAMVFWRDVEPLLSVAMTADDIGQLQLADSGSAEAQSDIGQLFAAAGNHEAAAFWLSQAANQDYPDAMQTLGRCYVAGEGVPKNEHLGVMWLAKAAAAGHTIAQAQMQGLGVGRAST